MSKIKKCKPQLVGKFMKSCDDCEFYKQLSSINYNNAYPIFSFIYLQPKYILDKSQKEDKISLS